MDPSKAKSYPLETLILRKFYHKPLPLQISKRKALNKFCLPDRSGAVQQFGLGYPNGCMQEPADWKFAGVATGSGPSLHCPH
jgi:hypothetical protein